VRIAGCELDENLTAETIADEVRSTKFQCIHPFRYIVRQKGKFKASMRFVAPTVAGKIHGIDPAKWRKRTGDGHHVIAGEYEPMHEDNWLFTAMTGHPCIDATAFQRNPGLFPSLLDQLGSLSFHIVTRYQAGTYVAAICLQMAQSTTPPRIKYNSVNVTIGIHNSGIEVMASDVRITWSMIQG